MLTKVITDQQHSFDEDSIKHIFDHHGWRVEHVDGYGFVAVTGWGVPKSPRNKKATRPTGYQVMIGRKSYL